MHIVKLSSAGKITIPKECLTKISVKDYAFKLEGKKIVLQPLTLKSLVQKKKVKDSLGDFGMLSEKSFNFWNNKADDVYGRLEN